MRAKHFLNFYLPILVIILASGIGVSSLWHFAGYRLQERQLAELQRSVSAADSINDHKEAIRAYEALASSLPEVQVRILQREWAVALDLVGQIQRSKYNQVLENDVPGLYDALLSHLDKMRDRSSVIISGSAAVPDDILWRVHNMGAAERLLSAYAILETERNWPKVQGTILESLADLKMAIEAADRLPGPATAKNIPRWNLELLYDQQYVQKFSLFSPENQNRMDLKDNLEMLIPERGGYAPGEPMDRSIRK